MIRGDTFRSILLRVGEIRSLLPKSVTVLAMTATATKTLRTKVSEVIGLVDPLIISISPCKPNIILCHVQVHFSTRHISPSTKGTTKEKNFISTNNCVLSNTRALQ